MPPNSQLLELRAHVFPPSIGRQYKKYVWDEQLTRYFLLLGDSYPIGKSTYDKSLANINRMKPLLRYKSDNENNHSNPTRASHQHPLGPHSHLLFSEIFPLPVLRAFCPICQGYAVFSTPQTGPQNLGAQLCQALLAELLSFPLPA